MASSELERYRRHIRQRLESLTPVFAKVAVGEFPRRLNMPRSEDELTEFFVGIQLMLNVIREKIAEHATVVKRLQIVNDRLANEKALDEAILGSIGEGLITIDPQERITFMNKPAADILDLDLKNVLGRSYADIAPLRDRRGAVVAQAECPIAIALTQGKKADRGLTDHLTFARSDGALVPIAIVATPIVHKGHAIGAVSVFRDISEEVQLDQAKNGIISIASHQLRTPLTTVKWYAEAALDLNGAPTAAAQDKLANYLATIHEANRRMIDLVDALLHVSRIELGTLKFYPQTINLGDIARQAFADLGPIIQQKQLNCKLVCDKKSASSYGDPEWGRTILQNLLSNAVRYTPANGAVKATIRTGKHNITIVVQDTGCGIPKSQQPKIFTKLFRTDNAKKLVTDGSGLGLYVVKSLVEHEGGQIWFESEENKGSTFHVKLPLNQPPKAKHH